MRSSAIVDRVAALLERTPPFDRLRQEDRRRLLGEVLIEYFEPDEVILEQGRTRHEFLYVVESGFVRLLDNETQVLIRECAEGDVFGSHGLLRGGALPYEARAVEPTVCILLRARHFRGLYEEHRPFAAFFDTDLDRYARGRKLPLDASNARLLFGTRIGELVQREPVVVSPDVTAKEAARLMRREHADSVLVMRGEEVVGILSDMDLRDRLVAEGASFETPVERLMNEEVIRLRAGAPVFDALMEMMRRRARHVVVTEGTVLGVVSEGEISRAQGASPAAMMERIEGAGTVGELSRIRAEVTRLLIGLDRQGVRPSDLIAINTEANDRIIRRAIHLVETELRGDSPVPPVDLPWAWMSLGSEGRGEMSLKTDQDNALVYADPSGPEEAGMAERWFGVLAARANDALAACGFEYCRGGVMARNPKWRKPLGEWRGTFRRWILRPDAYDLMDAGIFFDLRGLYGEVALVETLKSGIAGDLGEQRLFLPFLARNVLAGRSSPSLFGRLLARSWRHEFDLKRRGIRPLVDVARLFAMDARYLDSANTADRLRHSPASLPGAAQTAENALDAYQYLSEFRFRHHLQAIERGKEPGNRLDLSILSRTQQSMMSAVFSTVEAVQDEVANRYGASR
ncbi:MAG: DUF294 nucleotidyltransferase-like domain-containing protein [Actinomycetota bacterium]